MARTDILERKDKILQWISEGKSKTFIATQLCCKPATLNSYLDKMGIDYKGRQDWNKGQTSPNYISAIEYAQQDNVKSHVLKNKLIRDGIKKYQCEYCGKTEWQGQPIPLELHHIDGNHFNNQLDNLAIICPNCHALQPNNAGKNINSYKREKTKLCPVCKTQYILETSNMCRECHDKQKRVVDRPDRETLKSLIRNTSFLQLGKQFNVSDNAIRKWCDNYNLPRTKTEIKSYSDEEWRLI
jgi:hypothetical protein